MEQKHAMLYPDTTTIPTDQRSSAAAAIGLPLEPPPTYDVATAPMGWCPSATDTNYPTSSHYSPQLNHQHLPVIVEQPNFPLPVNQQPQPQSLPQQSDGVPITSEY